MLLIEICCRCGTCHRDDRSGYRSVKAHFHWMPLGGEVCVQKDKNELRIHATICTACIPSQDKIDWPLFFESQRATPARYRAPHALNAPLPLDFWSRGLDAAYATFARAFEHHLGQQTETLKVESKLKVYRVFFTRSSSAESTFTQTVTIDKGEIPKSLAAFAHLLSARDVLSVTRVEKCNTHVGACPRMTYFSVLTQVGISGFGRGVLFTSVRKTARHNKNKNENIRNNLDEADEAPTTAL